MKTLKIENMREHFSYEDALQNFSIENIIIILYFRIVRKRLENSIIRGNLERNKFLEELKLLINEINETDLLSTLSDSEMEKFKDEIKSISISNEFKEKIRERFTKELNVFLSELEIRDWGEKQIVPILKKVFPLIGKMEQDGIDSVYHEIEEISKKEFPSNLEENISELFFIVFLPTDLRYSVQKLFINKMILNDLEERKLHFQKAEQKIITLLQESLTLNILSNRHWEFLMKKYGSSLEIKSEILTKKQRIFRISREISKILREENISINFLRHIRRDSFRYISFAMDNFAYHYDIRGYYKWAQTDIGHGFQNYSALSELIDSETQIEENKQKKISKALIFEDDPQQMERYKRLIYECTPYEPNFLLENSSGINLDNLLKENEIEYFLIDIENGEDRKAGIRVTKKILEFFLSKKDLKKEIFIKLWSSSKEMVDTAFEELYKSPLIKKAFEEDSELLIFFGERSKLIKRRINFFLCNKRENPKDFEHYRFDSYQRAKEILGL